MSRLPGGGAPPSSHGPRSGRPGLRPLAVALSVLMAAECGVAMLSTGQAFAVTADSSRIELPSSAPRTAGPAEAQNEASARVKARLENRRIEILDARSETVTLWANPDGSTTQDMATGPVRFKGTDGRWQDVDVSLVQQPDGKVTAKGHPLGLTLAGKSAAPKPGPKAKAAPSAGSAAAEPVPSTPLVTLQGGADGQAMTLSWRGALPAPTLEGTKARYPDALTATDLVIESTRTGFEQFLELKDRSAVAANGSVTMTLDAKGLTARANEDRSVSFIDPKTGLEAGVLPAPVMWDAQVDPRTGDHRNTAPVGLKVSQNGDAVDLTLTPDAAFLNDPKTQYPVTVDPAVNLGVGFDTFVQQGYATDVSSQTELKLGNNGSGQVARSFLQFPMAKITGKQIQNAKLNLWNFHSWSCTAKGWEVWDTGSASTATRWTAQPGWNKKWASSTSTKGYSSSCGDGWVNTDVTTLVQAWANNGNANNTLGIRATDETDEYAWKKFNSGNAASNTPYLSVTYNTKPGAATPISPLSGALTNDSTPTLTGKATDPDGNTVQLSYEIWAANGTAALQTGKSAFAASGTNAPWTPTTALAPGAYKWRAAVYDGLIWNGTWSAWQTFTVDTTAPGATTIGSADFPAGAWSGSADGSGNFTGNFTFTPPSSDVKDIQYKLDGGAWVTVATTGAAVTKALTFKAGQHTVTVHTRDAAGNLSADRTHVFYAGKGAALTTPGDGERPARRTVLQAEGKSSYTGVRYQYRRGEADAWKDVPTANVTTTGGGSLAAWPYAAAAGKPAPLTWNITDTLAQDGPVDVRAVFTDGSATDASEPNTVTVDRKAGTAPNEAHGPGTLNLLTGDYTLSATDASAFQVSATRSLSSRNARAQEDGQAPIFGAEWSAGTVIDVNETAWSYVKQTSATSVALVDVAGREYGFTATTGGGWKPEPGAEELTLTGTTATSFALKDTGGDTVTFTKADAAQPTWRISSSAENGIADSTTTVTSEAVTVGGKKLSRPKLVIAPTTAVAAATCASVPSTAGCRVLEYVYADATTGTDAAFGDFAGQVKELRLWATEPGASTATAKVVSSYRYDGSGKLREQRNPLQPQAAPVAYDYDAAGRVTKLTPGIDLPWSFAYGKAGNSATAGEGMLLSVSRAGLKPGSKDVTEGTATSTVVYDVPLTGANAPYQLGGSDVAAWGQTDAPTDATAILPPDAVPAGNAGSALTPAAYKRAAITYTNASGREVNSAVPGGHLTTTEYDRYGNTVRALSAANRSLALGLTAADKAVQSDLGIGGLTAAARAELLSARTVFNDKGTRALETFGPLRRIELTEDLKNGATTVQPAGATLVARNWTVSEYDQGRPADATVEDQVTKVSAGAQPLEYPALMADARVTETAYDWVKGLPVREVQDPNGQAVTNAVEYDAQGRAVKELLPGATGADAATTVTSYWSGTGTGPCKGRPEWADLACTTGPAGAITGGGANPAALPVITSEYDWWGQQTKVTETVGATTRTNTTSYDPMGRTLSVTLTGGLGQAPPQSTTEYDPVTGRAVRTVSPTGGTITREYDRLGRMVSYTDADGGVTRAEYDLLNRLVKTTDSAPSSVSYVYDHAVEPRGLAVRTVDSVAGSFAVAFDPDGEVSTEKLPGGYTLNVQRDPAGAVTSRVYTRDSDAAVVMSDSVTRAANGELTSHSGWSSQDYRYDRLGRLTSVEDTTGDTCTKRSYTFDKRANRTSLTTAEAAAGAGCPATGGTTATSTYDSADRLVDAGHAYDALGRTTNLPGVQVGWYANDLLQQQTTDTRRQTWALDANLRNRSWTTEGNDGGGWVQDGARTNHYASDGDSPRWITEDAATGELTRIVDTAGGSFGATTSATGDVVLQFSNVHGDVALRLPLDPADSLLVLDNDEYGNPRSGQPATRYNWLGEKVRSSETPTGTVLMGARVYNPASGRFLSTDPVPNGGANAYGYCSGDPVNCRDTTGTLDYSFKFDLGNGTRSASGLFKYWMANFGKIFPLKGRANKITYVGQKMDLRDSFAWGMGSINFNVRVAYIGSNTLKLGTRKGSFVHGRNSYIQFTITKGRTDRIGMGRLYLTTHGHTAGDSPADDCIDTWYCPLTAWMYRKGAHLTWEKLAGNLRRHV
ncbi:DNRLRE domain-containing protein [Kitasatospora sp. NPDC051853]|uniref:DNRLRE domain-containing protein n=1 Tax=Kitasatospora sp. NPDC051853 TaxID=3364058 RepID=UPI003792A5CF